ncbi:PIN domain-containing protein [Microbacterium aurum]|uniref:PIN domain-containing protein n=1 Tax=Microbacterium aurum TaxID=36805 RepID=UPI0028ECD4F9|nr:PIN domain-containing protein [Microbacterium aurum]
MSDTVAFDADVIIYAAATDHPLGARVRPLIERTDVAAIGSVLLLPEVLAKPMRADASSAEVAALIGILSRLELLPLDAAAARLAVALAARHRLRAADAAHLATAVAAGAEQFVTNNRKDFPRSITEINVVYPSDL